MANRWAALNGPKGIAIVMTGSVVLAVGAGWGMYAALSGGTQKTSSAKPLLGSTSAPSSSPAAVAAVTASCTIGESGHDAQITISGNGTTSSTCAAFGQSLAQADGGFWQVEAQDIALSLVCVMDLHGGSMATVLDDGGEIIGRGLCQDLQAAGYVEDTASEAAIVQAQESASAAAAAASESAAAAAAEQSKEAADLSNAEGAMSAITTDSTSLGSDVQNADGAVSETASALKQVKDDAANGPGDYCGNTDTVIGDADSVDGDEDSLVGDLDSVSYDIKQVRSDVAALQQDDQVLSSENVAIPSGVSDAILAGQQAVKDAISKANADIDAVARDVTMAYQVAASLATGSCSSSGVGSAPTPPAHLS